MGRRRGAPQPCPQGGRAAAGGVSALHAGLRPDPRAAHTGAMDQGHVRAHCRHHRYYRYSI